MSSILFYENNQTSFSNLSPSLFSFFFNPPKLFSWNIVKNVHLQKIYNAQDIMICSLVLLNCAHIIIICSFALLINNAHYTSLLSLGEVFHSSVPEKLSLGICFHSLPHSGSSAGHGRAALPGLAGWPRPLWPRLAGWRQRALPHQPAPAELRRGWTRSTDRLPQPQPHWIPKH